MIESIANLRDAEMLERRFHPASAHGVPAGLIVGEGQARGRIASGISRCEPGEPCASATCFTLGRPGSPANCGLRMLTGIGYIGLVNRRPWEAAPHDQE